MTLLEPVIAAILAAWLFAERLGAATAAGAVVILAAIGVASRGIDTDTVVGRER
jgi:drug/metabolite transporter (DMT)-like permease